MDSEHNTAIQISSVEVHDKTVDMCTFFQWNSNTISTTSNDVINLKPNRGCCFFMFLFFSWSVILIYGHSAQHRNTNFQCGSA